MVRFLKSKIIDFSLYSRTVGNLESIIRDVMRCEDFEVLLRLLLKAVDRGRISYEEALSLGSREEVEEALLEAYMWRMLIPYNPSSLNPCLSWSSRNILLKRGEMYEMPNIIIILVQNTVKTGEWNPCKAVRQYFRDIGEPEPEKYVKLYKQLLKEEKGLKVTPKEIVRHATSLGINPSPAIAKLKGAGIISPIVDGQKILYEINPSLTINQDCE